MAMSDPLGDMLTRIRNGQMANKSAIKAPASKLRANVLEVLRREGYIRGYETSDLGGGKSRAVDRAQVSQWRAGDPRAAPGVQARPARSMPASMICRSVYNGLGIAIVSTPRGVLSDAEAREARVGGEVLCTVF